MGRITAFKSIYGTYLFPANTSQALDDNFKDMLARSTRLPGVDGGLDEFGTGNAPSAVGNVPYSFYLVSPTREGMQAKLDELGKMVDWGVGTLWYQPTDLTQRDRWAHVRVNRISDPQRLEGNTDLFMPVSVYFQASQPYWYGRGSERLWDDGNWDDGDWDSNGSAPAPTSVTDSGTVTISNVGGNVHTLARLLVINDSAGILSSPRIERVDARGEIVDWVQWYGDLASGDVLEISPRQQTVRKNGANGYPTFDKMNPDWMWLRPGSNTLRVRWAGTGKLAVRWLERYK